MLHARSKNAEVLLTRMQVQVHIEVNDIDRHLGRDVGKVKAEGRFMAPAQGDGSRTAYQDCPNRRGAGRPPDRASLPAQPWGPAG